MRNGRVSRVNALTALARRPVDIHPDLALRNLNGDLLGNLGRDDVDGGKRRVPALLASNGLIRTNRCTPRSALT